MRVIHLTHGKGNGVNTACLMTASNMLIGKGKDGDDNACVCPLLRSFIIATNDRMPEELLSELYGPLIWEILGTRTENLEVMQQRAFAFADWAVREITPIVLRAGGKNEEAAKLEGLASVVDHATATAATTAAYAATRDAAYTTAAAAAAAAATAATAAAYTTTAAAAAANAAANAAAYAAAYAANVWRKCPEIIRRVAAIGDTRPVERVITREELVEALTP